LRGSLKTDDHRIQLLAFKMRELQYARYKRFPEQRLPSRLTSTVAGVDCYLTEIRNLVKSSQDVSDIWGCDANDIKVLGIDLGQSFVVGASTILPDQGDRKKQVFYNLAVSQKAVYQPRLRLRNWSEQQKMAILPGEEECVADIESRIPPLRDLTPASRGIQQR